MAQVELPRFMKESRGRADCWRWEIGGRARAQLVAAGFKSQDLKDASGEWLEFRAAKKLAEALNHQVDQWKAGVAPDAAGIAPPPIAAGGRLTVGGMITAWQADETYITRAHTTREGRRSALNALRAAFGDIAPAKIRRADVLKFYSTMLDFAHWKGEQGRDPRVSGGALKLADYLALPLSVRLGPGGTHEQPHEHSVRARRLAAMEERDGQPPGAPMGFNTCAIGRQMWTWAQDNLAGFAAANPFQRLALPAPQGRVRRITDDELAIIDQASIDIGMPELGDAFFLGIWSTQRRADMCAFSWTMRETGRVQLKQQKTGTVIDFRAPTALMDRLETIWKRQRAARFNRMDRILLDARGHAYDNPEELTRYLPRLRNRAVEIQRSKGLAITLDDVVLHDSRDTGVIMRFEAHMDTARVSEHSGHSLRALDLIKKSYLGRNIVLADQATDMLDALTAKQAVRG